MRDVQRAAALTEHEGNRKCNLWQSRMMTKQCATRSRNRSTTQASRLQHSHPLRCLQSERLRNVACLVTDLCMPGMNGLELHQQLMASNHLIPATLMTECAEELVREQAL
jgi:CheY-like chemotaxis protein